MSTPRNGALSRALLLMCAVLIACRDESVLAGGPPSEGPATYNPDWTTATHSDSARPSYAVVFPQDSVNRLEIVMTAPQWSSIQTNMRSLFGYDFGGPWVPIGVFPSEDPEYVDVTVRLGGKQWRNVGFRLKGNSSLSWAWGHGIYKLPFRLKFDEFEDQYPLIADQRFYGFKELSLSPGWSDNSLIREKLTADVFRLAGIPAARTAFYRVYVDFGAGLQYCGVYTMVEVIDDTMVDDQFGEDGGNIYKPESRLQTFVKREFEKKNNKPAGDYSDVTNAVVALNSPLRTSNPVQWRANLEAVFNVDHFLKWLAVSNAIVNWDSYGTKAHNYYLYNHSTKRLTWIPWDHNLAMIGSPGLTGAIGDGVLGLSLSMNEVGSNWPLIRYLMDDAVYAERYRAHLQSFTDGDITEAALNALIDRQHAMISPYVLGASGEQPRYTFLSSATAFTSGLDELKTHVRNRRAVIEAYLAPPSTGPLRD